jgi:hypothetical protein
VAAKSGRGMAAKCSRISDRRRIGRGAGRHDTHVLSSDGTVGREFSRRDPADWRTATRRTPASLARRRKFVKKMMDQKTMIEIGLATPDQIAGASWLFGKTFDEDTSWIQSGVKTKQYTADVVKIDGSDRYIIVHHVNEQKVLTINAVAQLSPFSNFDALMEAFVFLAKKFSCRAIEGITRRRGLVEKCLNFGFQPCGVMLQKVL